MDPGGQRRQGAGGAIFRPEEPVRSDRRSDRRQERLSAGMRLEYFQLVDRIVEISPDGVIRVESKVPTASSIFEGHFPGHPLMPGVLLIEAMAQTAGWLIIAATRFERMPFLAAVKEAKLRTFVTPGQLLSLTADLVHEGSGYAMTA